MTEQLSQSFAYEIRNGSAVILRCFSCSSLAEIPETLDGHPVTELAPYAFSAGMDQGFLNQEQRAGRLKITGPLGNTDELSALPALCGDLLEELTLPYSLQKIGRYCFYNCSALKSLSFYGPLTDWGRGCFTGCHRIERLTLRAGDGKCPALKQLLGMIAEALSVTYLDTDTAQLIFPSFYEESVENTPARILETHIHGSGIYYRNCFKGEAFDFSRYDSLFPSCEAMESEELLIRLSLGRLLFPFRLENSAEMRYKLFISEHAREAGEFLIDHKDERDFAWFLGTFSSESLLGPLSDYAAKHGNAAAVSLIAETRHMPAAPPGRSRMEL